MSDLERVEGSALEKSHRENYEKAKAQIVEYHGVTVVDIYYLLKDVPLTSEQKEEITLLLMEFIQKKCKYGQFKDLEDARSLFVLLGIENVGYSREWLLRIEEFQRKFEYFFLVSLTPSLYDGKLIGGKPYDRREYTKKRLRDTGYPEDQITDELVDQIWELREVLVMLHDNRVQFTARLGMLGILELPERT